MREKQQAKKDDINILIYSNHHEIHITASSVIRQGLLTIQEPYGMKIIQKVLSNTNYEHVIIPDDIKIVNVNIISNEINYDKILRM